MRLGEKFFEMSSEQMSYRLVTNQANRRSSTVCAPSLATKTSTANLK